MSERSARGEDRLEALRGELRSLGYLEDSLERFLLRDLFARPGFLAPALKASARSAALAGPLVAGVMAAALAWWHPALGTRPADLLVLLAYTALVAGLACFAAEMAGAVAGLALPRRPEALARRVRFAVTALWLGWFLPWVLFQGTGRSRILVLLALSAVALLLGRLCGLTALVLALERKGSRSGEEAVARRQFRWTAAVLALSVLALGGFALAGARAPAVPPASPIEAAPGGVQVIVLGIDGLAWDDLPERGGGDGPLGLASRSLSELAARGLLARLDPGRVPVPPVVWTTVATGRDPLDHGIRSLLVERVPGLDTAFPSGYGRDAARTVLHALLPRRPPVGPLSDELRREKTFWEVAGEAGLEVLAVNWWATYPASVARGSVVSDRAYATLAAGRPLTREVDPPELGRGIEAVFRAGPREAAPAGIAGAAAEAFRGDRFHADLALGLLGERAPRTTAVYLQALDVMAASARSSGSEGGSLVPRRAYGAWLAGVLDRLASGLGPERALLLVGHPGRARPGTDGVLLLAGGPVRGPLLARARVRLVDVAPTALVLAGLPVSGEQAGRALLEAVDPAYLAGHPPRAVPSFGRRAADPGPAFDPTDAAAAERLRSLGYVN